MTDEISNSNRKTGWNVMLISLGNNNIVFNILNLRTNYFNY